MDKKKLEEYIGRLIAISENPDIESAHLQADKLIVEFLKEADYKEVAYWFDKVKKWYA